MMERHKKALRRNLEGPSSCTADDHHEKSQQLVIMKNSYYLGEELIVAEILPKLPVKSLWRFRCVSKSWYSLISSSNFVKSHLKKSTDDKSFTHHGIIVSYFGMSSAFRKTEFLQCSLRSWLDEPSSFNVNDFTSTGEEFSETQRRYMSIAGTCNGLCCIQDVRQDQSEQRFVLWNPATKESYRLPNYDSRMEITRPEKCISIKSGFGFDEANNDYKVLVMFDFSEIPPLLRLYSSRTNTWKEVEGFKDRTIYCARNSAIFLDGKLHFCRIGHKTMDIISYFDLEREEHGLLELPESLNKSSDLRSVGLFDGCLSCVLQRDDTSEIHIWIMRQYGLKESWQLVLNISDGVNYKVPFCSADKVLICNAKGGEIMFACRNGFMIYDPKSISRKNLIWNYANNLKAHIYVESLVSPVPESHRDTP